MILRQEVHKLNHYMKMGNNVVLECFNKTLDKLRYEKDIKIRGHFVIHSKWERKLGTLKVAYTDIDYINDMRVPIRVVHTQYATAMKTGLEDVLVEECERQSIIKFVEVWTKNFDKFVEGSYGV